ADRRKRAWIRVVQSAAGKKPAAIRVLRIRIRWIRRGNGGIGFDEARQSRAFRSDVAGFEQPVRAERALEIQIPILRVRKFQIFVEHNQGHWLSKSLEKRIRSIEG